MSVLRFRISTRLIVDNGYYDMYKVMKALVDVKYDGIVHLDHLVPMVGGESHVRSVCHGLHASDETARACG